MLMEEVPSPPTLLKQSVLTASLTIPTVRHYWNLQNYLRQQTTMPMK